MMVAVNLNDQIDFGAIKIEDIWPEGILPAKDGAAFLPLAKTSLDQHFRQGHILAQLAGKGDFRLLDHESR